MFVRKLLDRQGSIEMDDKKITISFEPYKSKKKNKVLQYLIDRVNEMNIRHPILNAAMQFKCK